eukprot:m.193181 g.193181  ORF g.193181 m.193181 type:complete len:116 (-) comp32494_c3_seq2:57-404(-)
MAAISRTVPSLSSRSLSKTSPTHSHSYLAKTIHCEQCIKNNNAPFFYKHPHIFVAICPSANYKISPQSNTNNQLYNFNKKPGSKPKKKEGGKTRKKWKKICESEVRKHKSQIRTI